MYYGRLLSGWLSRQIEFFRGNRTVAETTAWQSQIESLIAYAVSDYTVTLHCKERKFTCTYETWFCSSRVISTYEVFAIVSGKPPQVLIDACANEMVFPALLHSGASSKHQKEAAIEAYIDLVQVYLKTNAERPSAPMRL